MYPKNRKRRDPYDRFREKYTVRDDGCWEWVACRMPSGYGQMHLNGRAYPSHRFSYEYHVGPIPEGLFIDHLCRNRACVNPKHLEPVTNRENSVRGEGPILASIRGRGRTHCRHGHELIGENLYETPDGRRQCKTCQHKRQRKYYEKRMGLDQYGA